MRKPVMLLIAGAAATGKTTFAKYAAEQLGLALFCKDEIKQIVWEAAETKKDDPNFNRTSGITAYKTLYYLAGQMMRAKLPFILESNFRRDAGDKLRALTRQHGYRAVTVRFETDIEILHERFVARDRTDERHPSLRVEGSFDDIEVFRNISAQDRAFALGPVIKVNTDDFSAVDYKAILREIESALAQG